ncbi:hypothetical protein NQZ79_g910 [Umbelopsis isabellina]|nr:hypothetical protein NQZ79_g910 [Umbelopsis isabellina]
MSVVTDNDDNMLLPPGKIITSTQLHLSTNQARPLSVMVLGKPGEGKSSLLNGILGQQAFVAKLSVSQEVTKHVSYTDGSWLGGETDIPIRCIDTPPISGRLDDAVRISNECQHMLDLAMPGIDAFLVVIKLSRYRFDAGLESTLRVYESIFGRCFWDNVIIIFSHADLESAFDDEEPSQGPEYAKSIATAFNLSRPLPYCYTSIGRNRGRRRTADTRTMDDMKEAQVDYMDTLLMFIQSHQNTPYSPEQYRQFVSIHGKGRKLDYASDVLLPRARQIESLIMGRKEAPRSPRALNGYANPERSASLSNLPDYTRSNREPPLMRRDVAKRSPSIYALASNKVQPEDNNKCLLS